MNFTESFEQFSGKLGPTDLALYAGIGLVLWVLFKDKLSPIQQMLSGLLDKFKKTTTVVPINVPSVEPVIVPKSANTDDIFFKLVVSWKQTRDLAEKSGCTKAIEVADQMFPYLSPTVCAENKNESK